MTLFATVANAVPVTWRIDGVLAFEDGGTVSGVFTYDADTNEYSDVAITTTDGSLLNGFSYNLLDPRPSNNSENDALYLISTDAPNFPNAQVLNIDFEFAITNAGGTQPIRGINEYSCGPANCTGPSIYRYEDNSGYPGFSGTVSSVPIPTAAWLFGSALAGLGWARRRVAP